MSAQITCRSCNGTGTANNPPTFYNAGETPEDSVNCEVCKGLGFIEVSNPAGVRVAVLVAKKICSDYPRFKSWDEVYRFIVVNISNAVDSASSSRKFGQWVGDSSFDVDDVFSEETLPVDAILQKWIEKGNYLEEAKTILGIKE
jgi:hypothetical protein